MAKNQELRAALMGLTVEPDQAGEKERLAALDALVRVDKLDTPDGQTAFRDVVLKHAKALTNTENFGLDQKNNDDFLDSKPSQMSPATSLKRLQALAAERRVMLSLASATPAQLNALLLPPLDEQVFRDRIGSSAWCGNFSTSPCWGTAAAPLLTSAALDNIDEEVLQFLAASIQTKHDAAMAVIAKQSVSITALVATVTATVATDLLLDKTIATLKDELARLAVKKTEFAAFLANPVKQASLLLLREHKVQDMAGAVELSANTALQLVTPDIHNKLLEVVRNRSALLTLLGNPPNNVDVPQLADRLNKAKAYQKVVADSLEIVQKTLPAADPAVDPLLTITILSKQNETIINKLQAHLAAKQVQQGLAEIEQITLLDKNPAFFKSTPAKPGAPLEPLRQDSIEGQQAIRQQEVLALQKLKELEEKQRTIPASAVGEDQLLTQQRKAAADQVADAKRYINTLSSRIIATHRMAYSADPSKSIFTDRISKKGGAPLAAPAVKAIAPSVVLVPLNMARPSSSVARAQFEGVVLETGDEIHAMATFGARAAEPPPLTFSGRKSACTVTIKQDESGQVSYQAPAEPLAPEEAAEVALKQAKMLLYNGYDFKRDGPIGIRGKNATQSKMVCACLLSLLGERGDDMIKSFVTGCDVPKPSLLGGRDKIDAFIAENLPSFKPERLDAEAKEMKLFLETQDRAREKIKNDRADGQDTLKNQLRRGRVEEVNDTHQFVRGPKPRGP